jgi:hypothetical protein
VQRKQRAADLNKLQVQQKQHAPQLVSIVSPKQWFRRLPVPLNFLHDKTCDMATLTQMCVVV